MTKQIPDNKGKKYTTKKINPRAIMFRQFYLDPTSKTFWNIRGSALRAGYKEEYADNISSGRSPKWWTELQESAEYRRAEMLELSEKNMKKVLKDEPENDTRAKMQLDTSKFVSERVGKDHYSTRRELTDSGGKRLFNGKHTEDTQDALSDLFIGVQADTDTTDATEG